MRRLLAILICVCVLSGARCAMADKGNQLLLHADGDDTLNVVSLAYLDDTLYIMCSDKLYIYNGDLVAHEYQAPAQYDAAQAEVRALMRNGDTLRALVLETYEDTYSIAGLTLYKLEIAPNGEVSFGDPQTLNHAPLTEYGEYVEYMRIIENLYMQDNQILFTSFKGIERVFSVYDLDTHTVHDTYIENLSGIMPYLRGEALAIITDDDRALVCALAIKSGGARELFSISAQDNLPPSNALYDAHTGDIYYIQNDELYRVTDMRPDTTARVNTVHLNSITKQPVLTDAGLYVACDNYSVIMCSTAPDASRARKLVIDYDNDKVVQSAYYRFARKHADVDVRLTSEYINVLTAMLTRDDSVDIFFMYADNYDYMSMLERGYMAELTQSQKLTDFVAGMYPALRDAIQKDGELYAMPVEVETFEVMLVKNSTLEKLGLTRDDLPNTWMEFFEFLKNISRARRISHRYVAVRVRLGALHY